MKIPASIRNQRGSTTVETAIIFMLLMMFVFGIIEFGLLLFDKHILTNASREGARAGIVVGLNRSSGEHLTISGSEANNFCAAYLVGFGSSPSAPTISTSLADSDGNGSPSRGDMLTVSLSYPYNFLFLSALGIGPVQLDAISTMQLE